MADEPAEEQGITPNETSEEISEDMKEGTKEADPYTKEGREALQEDDELSPGEEGFMEGASGRGDETCCDECGKLLSDDAEQVFEREVHDKKRLFCSEEHAEKFSQKRQG